MKIVNCEVGMFRLPGVIIEAEEDETITEEQIKLMEEWCNSEFGTGMRMTDKLFSFRKESQRSWFILRWSGEDK
jgi:hypothetical protein